MKPLHLCQLYSFLDLAYLHGRSPSALVEQLCQGGSDLIQLRAKTVPLDEVRRVAKEILPIVQSAGVGLVINDHPQIAWELNAPFCHLGQEDFFDRGWSRVEDLHPEALPGQPVLGRVGVGLSTHTPTQARSAVQAGADYVGVGPVYATPTKPSASPVSLEYVRWAAANIQIPWFAIGGITLDNLASVLQAGASRICVVSAILQAVDVTKACQEFKDRLVSAGVKQSPNPC